jgi:5-formyltetrahydrofolate cyclo-ligase
MVKDKIRKSLLEQGRTLSSQSKKQLDIQVQENIIENFDLSKTKNVLLYFPFRQEINVSLLRKELLKYSHNVYVPKIFPEKKLKFNLYTNKDTLVKNKYGIFEVDNNKYLEPNLFDLMVIPFVGVDTNGHRIGYGGGYFDRALSCINKIKAKPIIIGLGYDYQIISEALAEPHDLKYQKVFTETKTLTYS